MCCLLHVVRCALFVVCGSLLVGWCLLCDDLCLSVVACGLEFGVWVVVRGLFVVLVFVCLWFGVVVRCVVFVGCCALFGYGVLFVLCCVTLVRCCLIVVACSSLCVVCCSCALCC